jgi:zinc protease
VNPDLVAAAKRRAVAHAEMEKTSIPGLAQAWSQALAVDGRPSPDDTVAEIQRVTTADVERVARRYLDTAHAVTAVLTPRPSGKAVAARPRGGKETFAVPNAPPVALPDWAGNAVRRLAVPSSTVSPVVTTLDNGLTLIVQPASVSKTVALYGRVNARASLVVPPGQEGVDEILDGLFSFGTESLDRVAYQRALDDIGADATAGAEFGLEVLAEYFERGVGLLADNQLRPALPEAAFKVLRQQVGARVTGRLQSAEYRARRALRAALFPPGDPTRRESSPTSVAALSLDDVRAYYRRAFRPDLTTIVVIGAVTPETAHAVVEKAFGAWTVEGPRPPTELPRVPLNGPAAVNVPNRARVQDNVTLAETLGLTRTDEDYYALQLGNHVLGGAFYATRLYRDLRQNAGLVYFVDAALEMDRTRGLYTVQYASAPSRVARVHGIIAEELRVMQTETVPPDELRQAKAVLLRSIPLAESSQERIARGLLGRALDGLPLDEPTHAARRYLALGGDEVKAAFAKWIRPQDLVQIVEGPAP